MASPSTATAQERRYGPAVAIGIAFSLYRFGVSSLYGSGLGISEESVGFVSNLPFVLAMNAASCLAALAAFLLLRAGRFRRAYASPWVALALLAAGVALGKVALGKAARASDVAGGVGADPTGLGIVLGAVCGVGMFMLCVAWFDVFVAQNDASKVVLELAIGTSLFTVYECARALVWPGTHTLAALAAMLLSVVALQRIRRGLPDATRLGTRIPKQELRATLPVYICFFVLVGVVGIMHTSVIGSSSEYVIGAVPMWVARVVALAVFLAVVLLMGTRLNPGSVFKTAFPLLIVVITLLPFVEAPLGSLTGSLAILCYLICGMLIYLFFIREGRRLDLSSALLACIYTLGSSGFLFVGLCVGLLLSAVSADFGMSRLTLLAFAAIYPLALVLVFLTRKDGGRKDGGRTTGAGEFAAGPTEAGELATGAPAEGVLAEAADRGEGAEDLAGARLAAGATVGSGDQVRHPNSPQPSAVPATLGEPPKPGSGAFIPSREDFEATISAIAEEFGLTKREREILSFLALGRSVHYIAETLVISENTAWTHVKRIYAKTGAHGKDELLGLIERRAKGMRGQGKGTRE